MLQVNIGKIHLIGIGGIGMSGIAEILIKQGYDVTGSDLNENDNTDRLKDLGVKIYPCHKASNVIDAQVVVKSSAVKDDNIEIITAKENNIPVIRRANMLAEITRLFSDFYNFANNLNALYQY